MCRYPPKDWLVVDVQTCPFPPMLFDVPSALSRKPGRPCLFREATQRKTEGAIDRVTRDEELRTKFQKHAVRVANCRRPVVALTADDRHSAVVTFAVARGGTGYCG